MQAFHIYDFFTLREKLVRQLESLVEITAGIATEIENHPFHTLGEQLLRGLTELLVCRPGEL